MALMATHAHHRHSSLDGAACGFGKPYCLFCWFSVLSGPLIIIIVIIITSKRAWPAPLDPPPFAHVCVWVVCVCARARSACVCE